MSLKVLTWATVILLCVSTTSFANSNETIGFAVSPMASPAATAAAFSDFIDYLSEKMGKKVILKQRRKYQEINDILRRGEVMAAFTCTGAYLAGREEFGLQLLVVPVVNGKTTYHSYIIVRQDSPIKSFNDLKGKVFAFTDQLSLSGRLYVTSLLNERGILTNEFFKKTFYTFGHEKSIEVVANGLADAASVDSLIFDDLKAKGSPYVSKLRIIKVSPPFGIPPFVVSPLMPEQQRKDFLKILLSMQRDLKGKKILQKIGIDGFVLPDHAAYHSANEVRKKVRE